MGAGSPATSEMRMARGELNFGSTKGCSENWLPEGCRCRFLISDSGAVLAGWGYRL